MSEIKKYQNWLGLEEYTKELKEWIWKLFRKVHARIGHVEEELAHVRETVKVDYELKGGLQPDNSYVYELYENISRTNHGKIVINTDGEIQLINWYDAEGIGPEEQKNQLTHILHWTGTHQEWFNKNISNDWDNYIVFAQIIETNGSITKCIRAGNKDYIYETGAVYWDDPEFEGTERP